MRGGEDGAFYIEEYQYCIYIGSIKGNIWKGGVNSMVEVKIDVKKLEHGETYKQPKVAGLINFDRIDFDPLGQLDRVSTYACVWCLMK